MALISRADGLRARDNGGWGRSKLEFLDRFGPPALAATKGKRRRVFVDLFAGPGRNVVRGGTGEEFDGSPIRILKMHAPRDPATAFTDAFFVNKDSEDLTALSTRIERLVEAGECRIDPTQIRQIHGDANEVISAVMATISVYDYVLVFADIEGIRQLPWSTVQALKAGGHHSVDFYMLFPLRQSIQRLMSFTPAQLERYAPLADRFFGTDAWRSLVSRRSTSAQTNAFLRDVELLYLERLKTLWNEARVVRTINSTGNRCLYKMLFASNHPVAKKLAEWEGGSQQYGMGF